MLPEFVALERRRLDRRWTFDQLAIDMKQAGVDISPRTLHHVLKRAHEDERPREATIEKVRQYLRVRRINVAKLARKAREAARRAESLAAAIGA